MNSDILTFSQHVMSKYLNQRNKYDLTQSRTTAVTIFVNEA